MPSNIPAKSDEPDAEYLKQFGGLNVGYATELLERYKAQPADVPDVDRPGTECHPVTLSP